MRISNCTWQESHSSINRRRFRHTQNTITLL